MPSDPSFDLVEANRSQRGSETDSFTPARYRQMQAHFPKHARKFWTRAATPPGRIVLKTINPGYELTGLDCVPERLAALDKTVYQQVICGLSSNLPVGTTVLMSLSAANSLNTCRRRKLTRRWPNFSGCCD